jgi:RNA polymerase sigma-70 factor (ECF subfamily)
MVPVRSLAVAVALAAVPAIVGRQRRETRVAAAEWGALMAAAQTGHGGAYRRLLGEVRPWLLRYYARRLPPAAVDDAVQEAMIALHTKRATYDPARPFGPWLAAIARYKWIDRLRAMKRTAADVLPDDIAVGDHESAVTSASVLASLLATLKGPQAAAIRLVKLDGLSIDEAAAATGQSPSLVKVNIHRGLARLAAHLAAAPGLGDDDDD